jgi:hypothetical protein
MKRMTLVTLTLIFLTAFCVAAGAQSQMTPQMCTNLNACSELLTDMNAAVKSGKLSPAQEQEVLSNINQIGRIMQEMSSPSGAGQEMKHTQELQEMRKKWRHPH